jgi:rubrerythrin
MFTIADICNIAVQIEKNGEETYRKASLASKNPEVAQLLATMAEDERRHAEWLAAITSDKPLTEEQREMEAVGRTLLQDMVKGNPFLLAESELQRAESVGEVLTRSKAFEEDTILFYQFIQEFLDDRDAAHQMQTIIAEEHKHVQHLELLEKTPPTSKKHCLSALALTICLLFLTLTPAFSGEDHAAAVKGQTVYVPAYSHIYHGNREAPLLLTITISIRNVSPNRSMTVTAVDYYDTQGAVVKKFTTTPFVIGPLGSERFVVPQNDESGGSGANFIVKWHSAEALSPPIIETIMIGTQNQLGVSFTSRGQAIHK